MSADNIHIQAQVAIQVLERYAFLVGGPPEPGAAMASFPSPSWVVTIDFSGACTGTVGMVIPPDLAAQAAANVFGGEPSHVSDEQAGDAVQELLNIVCGHYLHEREGDQALFNLSAPVRQAMTREQLESCIRGKAQAVLMVEDAPLVLFIEN